MGRPTKYTEAVLTEICERLSKGEPLAAICRDERMPDDDTVRNWMEHPVRGAEVSRAIGRAREAGEEWILAECKEIADDSRNDYIEALAEDGDERADAARFNGEHVQRSKLRIETRLKLLAKWNPKKWGERQTIEHDITGNLADELKAARERASR